MSSSVFLTPGHSSRSLQSASRISGRGFIHFEPRRQPPPSSAKSKALLDRERELTFKPKVGRSPRYGDLLTPSSLAARRAVTPSHFPFTPAVSAASRRLDGQRRRSQSAEPRWRALYEDASLFRLPKTRSASAAALIDCTFVPDVSSSSALLASKIKSTFGSVDKYFEARSKSPSGLQVSRSECAVFPFAPRINPAPHVLPVAPWPGVDKFCQRQRRAQLLQREKLNKLNSSIRPQVPPLRGGGRGAGGRSRGRGHGVYGPYPTCAVK